MQLCHLHLPFRVYNNIFEVHKTQAITNFMDNFFIGHRMFSMGLSHDYFMLMEKHSIYWSSTNYELNWKCDK